VYAVGQLSIGERARARENTRRGTRQRNRESASVREGTCTRVGEGERRSERQSEIFVLAYRVHDTTVSEREGCSYASNGCAISSHVQPPGGLAPHARGRGELCTRVGEGNARTRATKESITGCANDGARVCKHRRGDVNQWRRKFSQWSREHRGEHAAKNTRAIMGSHLATDAARRRHRMPCCSPHHAPELNRIHNPTHHTHTHTHERTEEPARAAARGRARERAFARERVREHEQHALAQDVTRQPTLETHWFSPVLSRRKQPRLARREGCLRVATQQKIHMSRRAVQENCKRAHLPGVHVGDHVEELDTPWLHAGVASAC